MEVEVLRVLQPALESFVEVCISLLVHFKAMNSSGLFRPILIICDQRVKNRLCDTSSITVHCWNIEPRNREKVLGSFDNLFHVYLMNGLQKYKKKIFFTVAF